MKEKIRYYVLDNISLYSRKVLLYLCISLLFFNMYAVLDGIPEETIFINMIYGVNNYDYIAMFLLLSIFFTGIILHRYSNKVEIRLRYNNVTDYFKNIINKVFLNISLIYLVNIIILFIFEFIKHRLSIVNSIFPIYNINSSLYLLWSVAKTYFYIIYICYLASWMEFNIKNKFIKYLFYVICLMNILIPMDALTNNNFTSLLCISSFYRYKNYGSIFNEIVYYISSIFFKYYSLNLIFYVHKKYSSKLNDIIKVIINFLKKNLFLLIIYLLINILNFLLLDDFSNMYSLLPIDEIRNLSFIEIATKGIGFLVFIFIICKSLLKEIDMNSCILFTRIEKKKWIMKKFFIFFIFIIFYRGVIYLFNFNYNCIYDFVSYIYLLLLIINYANNRYCINFIMLIIIFFQLLIFKINIYLLSIILIEILIILLSTALILKINK